MKPHLHFMGVGGVGMSGLARWYLADGYRVSGCDTGGGEVLEMLAEEGVTVFRGHDPSHVTGQADVDTLVHTMAVSDTHPEVQAARAAGVRTLKRIDLLAELLARHRGVAVTGSHGKSTTTGMIASLLIDLAQNPSVLIGAELPALGGNMRYGTGYVVAEVDESDPGFSRITSHLALVTNLGDDHIAEGFSERRNYHASVAALETALQAFAGNARTLLYCADWPNLDTLLASEHAHTYGFHEASDYRAEVVTLEEMSSVFRFHTPGGERYDVALSVPGEHNIQNAAGALAAVHLLGLDLGAAATALTDFRGVGRRLQRRGSVDRALVLDDYAVHPTEVEVVLTVAKNTGRRVRAVLQPHRWVRTAQHWPALADAAALADEVLVLDIYSAGESEIPGVSTDLIVDRLNDAGKRAAHHTLASAQTYLEKTLEPGDLIITLGAGDVWRVAQGLVAALGGDDGTA